MNDLKFKKIASGRALYVESDDKIWIAKGMTFFAIDSNGKRLTRKYDVGTFKERLIAKFRWTRQLLRQGIHHLLPLANGDFFVVSKRIAYLLDKEGVVKSVFTGFQGNKPGRQGVCLTPDGTIFFGEYTLNPKRELNTRLFRSIDGGRTFQVVYTFAKDRVRHIHFVKYDPYEKCLWLGTGDRDYENLLLRSDDGGATWREIGGGTQDWRAIGVCFTSDALIWGTDAGSVPDQNHIVRMDRKTKRLTIIADVEGPCHGCASFKDGRVFISTGVEGGENEKDRFARLKFVDGECVKEIVKFKKDLLPLILQYGVIYFPLGVENTTKGIFTTLGLAQNGENVFSSNMEYLEKIV